MNIVKYELLPDFLLERLVRFDKNFNGRNWSDLYNAISFLKSQHPDLIFNDVPYVYIDIANKTTGFIFIERNSDEIYYVYD